MARHQAHPSADVSPLAEVGDDTRVWHEAQIREGARVGAGCVIGKGVYIDVGVVVGDFVKIQNYACVYRGTTLESGVFVGPGVLFANDLRPRAINPDGSPKGEADWAIGASRVRYGGSVGAGSVVLPGVTIGRFALVGAGSVVTRDVPDRRLAYGNPARVVGHVCACGASLAAEGDCDRCDADRQGAEAAAVSVDGSAKGGHP